MIRVTDWSDLLLFVDKGDETIKELYVNKKHIVEGDESFIDMLKKPPFNVPEIYITEFLTDRDDTLMAGYTTKGTVILDEHFGFLRVEHCPMWNFIPAIG